MNSRIYYLRADFWFCLLSPSELLRALPRYYAGLKLRTGHGRITPRQLSSCDWPGTQRSSALLCPRWRLRRRRGFPVWSGTSPAHLGARARTLWGAVAMVSTVLPVSRMAFVWRATSKAIRPGSRELGTRGGSRVPKCEGAGAETRPRWLQKHSRCLT